MTYGIYLSNPFSYSVPINFSTTVWKYGKNGFIHNFLDIHPKFYCNISFFLYVPPLNNETVYAIIQCNWTKIQKTPMFSTVVEKLIGSPYFPVCFHLSLTLDNQKKKLYYIMDCHVKQGSYGRVNF